MFFERLRAVGRDVRVLHRARVAAVGPQTAHELEERGLLPDVVPGEFRAEAVAEAMTAAGASGQRVLLPRAAGAREILPALLREAGATVDEVHSYETVVARVDVGEVRDLLERGAVDLVTFTSSSTVRNFLTLLGADAVGLLRRTKVGCIGPITAETAAGAGLDVAVQPEAYTVPAFGDAILEHFATGTSGAAPR
jgi:uroporphyrinogen III methyltransferase/synthase